MKNLTHLLDKGKIVTVNHRLMQGGLGDIGQCFTEMKARRVRGKKLVYQVASEGADAESVPYGEIMGTTNFGKWGPDFPKVL
jgi:hypothetical protein